AKVDQVVVSTVRRGEAVEGGVAVEVLRIAHRDFAEVELVDVDAVIERGDEVESVDHAGLAALDPQPLELAQLTLAGAERHSEQRHIERIRRLDDAAHLAGGIANAADDQHPDDEDAQHPSDDLEPVFRCHCSASRRWPAQADSRYRT